MNKPKICLIVAISRNRAIGKNNKLLWYIPEDLKRFKALTLGHPIIMGRKTFESIGKPLPERTNIVVTRALDYKAEGCIIKQSVEDAIAEAKKYDQEEIYVIGGGQIYEHTLPFADRLCVTIIEAEIEGADTFFPEYPEFTKIVLEEEHEHDGLKFKFLELEKA